jgi:hypothetical protein
LFFVPAWLSEPSARRSFHKHIIDKYNCNIFTAIGGMKTFGYAYCGQIAISLIRKNNAVGKRALYCRAIAGPRPCGASIISTSK